MFTILKESPLFRGLDQLAIAKLLDNAYCTRTIFNQNELIAKRDTAYSGLMIILKGSTRGEVVDAAGRRRIIDNMPAPQLIAPAFLFGGYNRLPIDVVANVDNTEILTLHRGAIFEMMQDNTVVLSNFIDIISNRANYFSRKIYALSVMMLTEKVAVLLLSMSPEIANCIEMETEQMATQLDITRNAIEQTLSELAKRGFIRLMPDNSILIVNREGLEAMVNPILG